MLLRISHSYFKKHQRTWPGSKTDETTHIILVERRTLLLFGLIPILIVDSIAKSNIA